MHGGANRCLISVNRDVMNARKGLSDNLYRSLLMHITSHQTQRNHRITLLNMP